MAMPAGPQELLAQSRRVTIKVGSSLLAGDDGPRRAWLKTLAEDVGFFRSEGKQVVLVSSGAVALGHPLLKLPRSPRLDIKQAAAAAGQPLLMQAWSEAFAATQVVTAQLLLTFADTETRRPWLNARATLERLLAAGAIPIVNENDSVATEELRYGDNDRLSARVAQMVRSDLLVLLSDVDGLYSSDPRKDSAAEHIGHVPAITPQVEAIAGPAASHVGTGGMRTKLEAARLAARSGCATLIASGQHDHPIARLQSGEARGTAIPAQGSPASAYKQWIAGSLAPAGQLQIDRGAAEALRDGRSLLPAGVGSVGGQFERGDCVLVVAEDGSEVARGLVRYSAEEAHKLVGLRASDIEGRLGYSRGDALIHRDDLVLT